MPVPACASDLRTGVNQPPGSGTDYPFVGQDDTLGWVVLDVYLSYVDNTQQFTFPFYLSLRPTAYSPTATFDAKILDDTNAVVFEGSVSSVVAWDANRFIGEVNVDDAVLRLVIHAPCFDVMALNTWVTSTHALDARTYSKLPKRVRSLRVSLSEYQENIQIVAGYNIQLEQRATTATEGSRLKNQIYLDGVAGAGIGRLAGCDPEDQPLRLINQVGPDEFGNFSIEFSDCYRAQRQATVDYGAATPTTTFASSSHRSSLRVFNDCRACADCSYFVRTYRGLKVMWDKYATIATAAEAVRDQLQENIDRWNAAADCRGTHLLQTVFTAEPECRFFVGAMYCNYSECCIAQPELRFTFFRYVDGVPAAIPTTQNILKSFVQVENNSEEEVLPSVVWPVYSYKPDLVSSQNTFMARLRFCTTCATTETYGVYITVHFDDSAYTTAGCSAAEATVPAELSSVWSSLGLTTPTTRALAFKLVPANPEKEPFGCGCS